MVPGDWHCCPNGEQWNPDLSGGQGGCQIIIECLQPVGLCNWNSSFPFNPPTAWWQATDCIDQTDACCYTDIFGNWDNHYLLNVRY